MLHLLVKGFDFGVTGAKKLGNKSICENFNKSFWSAENAWKWYELVSGLFFYFCLLYGCCPSTRILARQIMIVRTHGQWRNMGLSTQTETKIKKINNYVQPIRDQIEIKTKMNVFVSTAICNAWTSTFITFRSITIALCLSYVIVDAI